jgi:hypothetical protein
MFTAVPLASHIHSVPRSVAPVNSCLRAPTRYMPLAAVQGAGFEPTRFSRRSAQRELLCDIMGTKPFEKPAVWMYQFG